MATMERLNTIFLCWKNKHKLVCLKIYFYVSSLRSENLERGLKPKEAEALRMGFLGDFSPTEYEILAFCLPCGDAFIV